MAEVVYLLHAEQPHPMFRRKIQHYIGRTTNLPKRLTLHHAGQGAVLCREWVKAGIAFQAVRVWHAGPFETAAQLERKLKNRKRASDFCPICRPGTSESHAPADTLSV